MTSTRRKLITGAATLISAAAMAQPPADSSSEVCQVKAPAIPAVNWNGQARYRAKGTVKDGRVVAIEVTTLSGGVERRANRALVQAIVTALQQARCAPGDHVVEKTFTFDLPVAAATSTAP